MARSRRVARSRHAGQLTRSDSSSLGRTAAAYPSMLFLVIERFRGGDPAPVYNRFRARGRMAPDGLRYVNSWVTSDLGTCYQVMECDDRALLDEWMRAWEDLVEFEVHPVITSAEASARVPAS